MSEETTTSGNQDSAILKKDLEKCEKCFYNLKSCEFNTHGFLGTDLLPRNEEGDCDSFRDESKTN